MTETIDSTVQASRKIPTYLMVLLILTSVNVGYNLVTTIGSFGAQESLEELQQNLYESLENSGTKLDELPAPILSAIDDFFPRFVNNMKSYTYYQLGYYLLLGIAVVLMFRLMRVGLFLYILIQLIGGIEFLLFFGTNWISVSISILMSIFALIWILLYWQARKDLH